MKTTTKDIVAHAAKKVRKSRKKTAPIYAQANAPDRCSNPRYLLQQALDRNMTTGDEYIYKCRRASCSIECNRALASKLSTCQDRRFKELPGDYLTFGGNLQLPKGSTPQDHAKVKRAFLQILRRAKDKHGFVLEVFAQRHSTTCGGAHWDITVYTNAPKTMAKSIILDSWTRSGGGHKALKIVPVAQITNWLKYAGKDDPFEQVPDSNPRLIPAKRSVCPLESHWHTRGFWGGRKLEDYWQDFLDERYPDRVEKRVAKRAEMNMSSNYSITVIASNLDEKQPPETTDSILDSLPEIRDKLYLEQLENQPDLTPFQSEVLRRYQALRRDPIRDAGHLRQTLPDSPQGALGASEIAAKWGWDIDYTIGILRGLESQGKAVQTTGQMVARTCSHGAWHRRIA